MVLRSGVCEKYPEEHVPYLLKIRRYGEDTDTVRSEGEDTVEDTKIRSKIPRYGEDTMISQDLLMFRVLHT